MSKLVKAPLVVAKLENGSDVYVYEGSPLPGGLREGEAERLADYLEDDEKSTSTRKTSK